MRPVYRTIVQKWQSTAHAFLQTRLLWLAIGMKGGLRQGVGRLSLRSLCRLKRDGTTTGSQQAGTRTKWTPQKCLPHFLLC